MHRFQFELGHKRTTMDCEAMKKLLAVDAESLQRLARRRLLRLFFRTAFSRTDLLVVEKYGGIKAAVASPLALGNRREVNLFPALVRLFVQPALEVRFAVGELLQGREFVEHVEDALLGSVVSQIEVHGPEERLQSVSRDGFPGVGGL